jgi:hypothetical protein
MPFTFESWVAPVENPRILFIAENCPNEPNMLGTTYFYRSENPTVYAAGSHNLLRNLCEATRIPRFANLNEQDKLKAFKASGYFLIDTYVHGAPWGVHTTRIPVNQIVNDIVTLDPLQIVFTCIRSNGGRFVGISTALPVALQKRIVTRVDGGAVFNSLSNRAFHGFLHQIDAVIESGELTLQC